MFGNYCMYVIYHVALAMVASLRCQISDSDPLLSSWLDLAITPCTQLPGKHVLFRQGYSRLKLSLLNYKWEQVHPSLCIGKDDACLSFCFQYGQISSF